MFFFEKKNQKTFAPVLLVAAFFLATGAGPRKSDPDWPCQQVKVSELSLGSFWGGPAVDLTADWQKTPEVADLVAAVSQRRMPLDQAVQHITAFAQTAKTDKNPMLLLVLAGVFSTLDHERTEVLNGLDRFGQRQKVLADGLRQDGEAVRAAQTDAGRDEARVNELTQRLVWDQQVFENRRQSLRSACEVPTTIEQRLFALAKAIQALLE